MYISHNSLKFQTLKYDENYMILVENLSDEMFKKVTGESKQVKGNVCLKDIEIIYSGYVDKSNETCALYI